MSAFQVSPDHLNYLVHALSQYCGWSVSPLGFDGVGAMLANENAASVNHCYAERHGAIEPVAFRFTCTPPRRVTPVQVIKAAECYRYQSCEHPGWATSPASRLIDQLISAAINDLPGYDEAAWEIA